MMNDWLYASTEYTTFLIRHLYEELWFKLGSLMGFVLGLLGTVRTLRTVGKCSFLTFLFGKDTVRMI